MEWINVIDTEQGAALDETWKYARTKTEQYKENRPDNQEYAEKYWEEFKTETYPEILRVRMEELAGEGKVVYHPEEPGAGLNLNGEWLDPRENLTPVLELLTDCRRAEEYGEPGYHNEDAPEGILFANWNEAGDHFMEYLEGLGFGVEWIDEWVLTEDWTRAYRSSPDSYVWTPSYVDVPELSGIVGKKEVQEDEGLRDWYVNEFLLNNPGAANVLDVDLSEYGFKELSAGHKNGLHQGMNDNPEKILRELRKQYREADFIFGDLKPSQFYTEFSIYGRGL